VLTVSVGVPLPPATVGELKLHLGGVAVAGVMAQVRFTVELKPPEGVTVTVDVAEPPAVMVPGDSVVAVTANVVTVRLAVVVWTKVPEVPVIVKLEVPPGADAVVFTESDALTCPLPDGTETEAGEQETPEGSPVQVKLVVPLNPVCGFT
jgi:hypothetical protein